MARYPGAIWKPIDSKFLPNRRMAAYNRVNLHVAVSEASSLHSFFNAKGRASSHFYVRKSGVVEQYVDTAYQAEADLDGNDATISIETQGGLRNANSEPWTKEQVETLAKIYAWAVRTHKIPVQMAKDSRIGSTSHGLSWHRLGIDGNFPGGLLAGRVSGGMRYSTRRGKICPGDAKIKQIPGIFERAKSILGDAAPEPVSKPAPEPVSKPAPKPAAKSSGPVLRKGSRGAVVRSLQSGMNRAFPAYSKLTVDGIFGADTERVVREFQRRAGIGVDGIVGAQTYAALERYGVTVSGSVTSTPTKSAPAPKTPTKKASGTVLRRGSRGSAVKALQRELNRVFPAYSRLAIDGIFGAATEWVVREFQRRAGIGVDGIVGPQTRAALTRHGVRI